MNKNKVNRVCVSISEDLMEKARTIFSPKGKKNTSALIDECIDKCRSTSGSEVKKIVNDGMINYGYDHEKSIKLTIRLYETDEDYIKWMMSISSTISRSQALEYIIALALMIQTDEFKKLVSSINKTQSCLTPLEPPPPNIEDFLKNKDAKAFNIAGSKWRECMAKAIHSILTEAYPNIQWATIMETNTGCGGFTCKHLHHVTNRISNDIDPIKTNVFKCIQATPYALVEECKKLAKDISEGNTTFKELSNAHFKSAAPQQPNLEHAARYLFLNVNSCRNMLKNLLNSKEAPEKQAKALLKKEHAIYSMSDCLHNVEIHTEDMFDIIKKYKNKQKCLFVVDPPYLLSSGYDTKFGREEHEKLCRCLQNIAGDFMLFCRVTEKKKSKEKDNDPTPINIDSILQNFYDIHYGKKTAKRQCYYIDVLFYNNGTTERIITSFPFEGATECWSGKKVYLEYALELPSKE